MSENMNGMLQVTLQTKRMPIRSTKILFSGICLKKNRVCWSCTMRYLMIV